MLLQEGGEEGRVTGTVRLASARLRDERYPLSRLPLLLLLSSSPPASLTLVSHPLQTHRRGV